jgi:hypothetical protein
VTVTRWAPRHWTTSRDTALYIARFRPSARIRRGYWCIWSHSVYEARTGRGSEGSRAAKGLHRRHLTARLTLLDSLIMDFNCHVCHRLVAPGHDGKVQIEGISHIDTPKAWVWGPVVVHDNCRLDLKTPFDDKIGLIYMALWQRMTP